MYLEGINGYKLSVSECTSFLEPKEVFPEPKKKAPKKKEVEKTGNKKVDMEMSPEEYNKDWNL
jgi:hypothetical protein